MSTALLTVILGLFFLFAGYHKLFNADRREMLRETLKVDLPYLGISTAKGTSVTFMLYWIPIWEILSGGTATLYPLWLYLNLPMISQFAMLPMIAILGSALYCEAVYKIHSYQPLDWADWVDDLLYLPETLLLIMAVAVFLS